MNDVIRDVLTFLIGIALIAAMLLLIYNSKGEEAQAWLIIGIIVQHFFSRQASASNFKQWQQSQPTVTTTVGPPPTTTVEPADRRPVE